MNNKNVPELFRVIQEKINLEAKEAGFSGHNLTIGETREDSLRKFLIKLLPNYFCYGNGVLIDSDGNKSTQQDIIIYSPFMSVLTEDSKLFPIDSVFSTIEVKTKLNKSELKKCLKSIASVKRLHKCLNGTVQCNIFAYSSDSEDTVLKNIRSLQHELKLDLKDLFDNLCINGKCLITKDSSLKALSDTKREFDYIVLDLKEKSLPYFLDSMIHTMDYTTKPLPIFVKYMGKFELGVKEWKLK